MLKPKTLPLQIARENYRKSLSEWKTEYLKFNQNGNFFAAIIPNLIQANFKTKKYRVKFYY